MERAISYSEILSMRQQNRFKNKIPNILFYDDLPDGNYRLWMNIHGSEINSTITDSGDITHFETYVKPYCNKYDIPTSKLIKTHDYSDNSSWVNGSSDSVYCIQPQSGKDIIIESINGKIDKGSTFGSGQEFELVIWQSISSACPAYASTKTAYGSPLYNPGGGVYTGWLKVYPSPGDIQESSVYVYLDSNVPQYMVSEFCYYSLDDFKDKADFKEETDTLRFKYEFTDFGAYINLRSSLNERIELYTNDNNELTKPLLSTVKAVVSAVTLEYNEF